VPEKVKKEIVILYGILHANSYAIIMKFMNEQCKNRGPLKPERSVSIKWNISSVIDIFGGDKV